jgi:hypothetical protein
MRGISWLAAKTGQLLKKDSAPWSKQALTFRPVCRSAVAIGITVVVLQSFNLLMPELNPSAQRCLKRFVTGDFNF